jgi:glycosyltransferase involved in cell wall biosynthesis
MAAERARVSATLIARDEAGRIAACLESLSWADEIVLVVDDRTTDDTRDIARTYTNKVVDRRFDTYSAQRQHAIELASCEWIFWVDCDEIVTAHLAAEIRTVLDAPERDTYRAPRLDYMFGRWIRHGGWYPQYHVRLFKRSGSRWTRDVHEVPEVAGSVGSLANPLLHYSHERVSDWISKMARYTDLEARSLASSGGRIRLWRALLEAPAYFAYKYFVQQGWRDGGHGLVLAGLLGCYRLLRNLQWWDLQQASQGPRDPRDQPPSTSRS